MPENKVTFGLRNAHYAVITEGVDGAFTYGTPVKLPGSTSIALAPRGEKADLYADDMLYYSYSANQGYDATLTLAKLPDAFRSEVLGENLDNTDKVLTEKSTAKPKKIALMFEFDGDVKATRHVLYNCDVSRPNINSSTKTTTVEPGTTDLTLIASPRPEDDVVKVSTTTDTPADVYDAWYSAVYEKTPQV